MITETIDGSTGAYYQGDIEGQIQISNPSIVFSNLKTGEVCGTIKFKGDKLTFKGNADESAKTFIYYLSKQWAELIKKEREEAVKEYKKKELK